MKNLQRQANELNESKKPFAEKVIILEMMFPNLKTKTIKDALRRN
jgi:hypothetical protein